jgi:hypothetical protein
MRAPANEPRVIPPGSNERIVERSTVIFKAEVDCLHRLPAANMGTARLCVDDVRRHLTIQPPLPIEGMHVLKLLTF